MSAPRYNTAGYGEPGHFFRIRAIPTWACPDRARVTFPCGHATFDSADDARVYLDHPGDTPHAARAYLAWLEAGGTR